MEKTKLNELSYEDLYSIWNSKYLSAFPTQEIKSKLGIITKRLKQLHKEGLVESIDNLPSVKEINKLDASNIHYTVYDINERYFPNESEFKSFESEFKSKLTKGYIQGTIATTATLITSSIIYPSMNFLQIQNNLEPINYSVGENLAKSLLVGSIFAISAFYSKKSLGDKIYNFLKK